MPMVIVLTTPLISVLLLVAQLVVTGVMPQPGPLLLRASGFAVDKNPQAGDVFQTSGGWGGYGHVGYVERVNEDGSVW
jgi:hypothetical protein